jgi:hypothetical protein
MYKSTTTIVPKRHRKTAKRSTETGRVFKTTGKKTQKMKKETVHQEGNLRCGTIETPATIKETQNVVKIDVDLAVQSLGRHFSCGHEVGLRVSSSLGSGGAGHGG